MSVHPVAVTTIKDGMSGAICDFSHVGESLFFFI